MEIKILFLVLLWFFACSISLNVSHIIYNSIVFIKIKKRYGGNITQFLNNLVKDKLKFNEKEIEKYVPRSFFWSIVWVILYISLYYVLYLTIINPQSFLNFQLAISILLITIIPLISIIFASKVDINNIKSVKTNLDFLLFKLPIFIDFDFSFFYFSPGGKLSPLGYIPPFEWKNNNKIYSKYLSLLDELEKLFYVIPSIIASLLLPYVAIIFGIIVLNQNFLLSLIVISGAIYLWALQMVQIRESIINEFIAKNPHLSKILLYIINISLLNFYGGLMIIFIIFYIWLIYQSIYLSLNPTSPHYGDRWFIFIMLIAFPIAFFWRKFWKKRKNKN